MDKQDYLKKSACNFKNSFLFWNCINSQHAWNASVEIACQQPTGQDATKKFQIYPARPCDSKTDRQKYLKKTPHDFKNSFYFAIV